MRSSSKNIIIRLSLQVLNFEKWGMGSGYILAIIRKQVKSVTVVQSQSFSERTGEKLKIR